MTISQTEAASRKVRRCQATIDSILEQAGDATEARQALLAAQSELAVAAAAAAEREAADEDRIAKDAEVLADAVVQEINAALAAIAERLQPLPVAKLASDQALAVARARRELAAAEREVSETAERLEGLRARLNGLQVDRTAVIERRMGGSPRDSDAGTLALLDADIQGVGDLTNRTAATLEQQEATRQGAAEQLRAVETRWKKAVEAVWCDSAIALARHAENIIVDCDALTISNGGRRRRWEPARDLANLLHHQLAA